MSQILVSSSDLVVESKAGIEPGRPHFKANQTIKARVAEVLPSRRVTLIIQGQKVSAKTYVPLKPGEKVLLKVSKAGAHPIFKLMEVKGDGLRNLSRELLHILEKAGPYGRLATVLANIDIPYPNGNPSHRVAILGRMEKLVKALSLRSSKANPDFLRSLIKGSGLAWERRLSREMKSNDSTLIGRLKSLADGDLKALAMRGVAGRHPDGDEVTRNIQTFLEGLEKLQILNRFASEESGRVWLPVPVWLAEEWKFGQLLLDWGRKDKAENRPENRLVKLSFLLEMSNMGNVRGDFALFKNVVNGSFSVGDQDIRLLVEENIADLIEKLNQLGFEVQNIGCQVVSAETLASASLMDQIFDRDQVGLNLVI